MAKADKVIGGIAPGTASSAPTQPMRIGLWDLAPAPAAGMDQWEWWQRKSGDTAWLDFLSNRSTTTNIDAGVESLKVTKTLHDMSSGTFSVDTFQTAGLHLVADWTMHVPRLTRLLESWFAGGALSLTWDAALTVSEAAAARRLTGLAGLLRMLCTYAHECPPRPTPPKIAALAASGERTKAATEARRLAEGLGGLTHTDEAPVLRNLWRPPSDPVRVTEGFRWQMLKRPVEAATVEHLRCLSGQSWLGTTPTPDEWIRPAYILQLVLHAAHDSGVAATRAAAIASITHRCRELHGMLFDPLEMAVDVWASGLLDSESLHLIARAPFSEAGDAWSRKYPNLPSELVAQVESGSVTLPPNLGIAGKLHLLHALECLLLAPEQDRPLSTPTRSDGSLGLGALLDQLEEPGPVGPIDLVLALNRLADVEPDGSTLAARLDRWDPGRSTEPAISGGAPLPVAATVRRWLDGGGLGSLSSRIASDHPRRWAHEGARPVARTEVALAPLGLDELATRDRHPSFHLDFWLRITPGWPDSVRTGAQERAYPDALLGQLGLRGHGRPTADWLVGGLMAQPEAGHYYGAARQPEQSLTTLASTRMAQGWLSQDLLTESVLRAFTEDDVTLTRASQVFETLFLAGGMVHWWHPALALAGHACAMSPAPAGLDRLLTMLADYVHEVPAPVAIPDGIRAWAAATGDSRSTQEARRIAAGAVR